MLHATYSTRSLLLNSDFDKMELWDFMPHIQLNSNDMDEFLTFHFGSLLPNHDPLDYVAAHIDNSNNNVSSNNAAARHYNRTVAAKQAYTATEDDDSTSSDASPIASCASSSSDEDDEYEQYAVAPARSHKRVRYEPTPALQDANTLKTDFLRFYKKSVRLCEPVHLGTFDISKAEEGFEIQYLSQIQPIPNRLLCRFKMFNEHWRSSIQYQLSEEDGVSTVLRFSVLHIESNVETSMVETVKEAETRRVCVKPRTICNRVFLQALKRCRAYLLALPESTPKVNDRLACLSASGSARKCTESISLFGLRSDFMKEACVRYFDNISGKGA